MSADQTFVSIDSDDDESHDLCPACDEFLCRIPPDTVCRCGMHIPMLHRTGCEYCTSTSDSTVAAYALLFDPWEPSPYELRAREEWFKCRGHTSDCWCSDCCTRYTLTRGGEDHCAKVGQAIRLPLVGAMVCAGLVLGLAFLWLIYSLLLQCAPRAYELAVRSATVLHQQVLIASDKVDFTFIWYCFLILITFSMIGYLWHVLFERVPVEPSLPIATIEELPVKRDAVVVLGADEASVAYPRYFSMEVGEWPKGVFLVASKDNEKMVHIGMGDCVRVNGKRYLKCAAHELEASGWFDKENPAYVICKNGMIPSTEFKIVRVYPKPLDLVIIKCSDDSIFSRLGLGSNEVGHVPKHGSAVGYTYRYFPQESKFKKSYGSFDVIEGGFLTTCDSTHGMSGSPLIYNGKSVGNHLGAALKEGFNRGVSCSFLLRKGGKSRDESLDNVRYAEDWAEMFQKYADAYDDYSDDDYEPWFDNSPVPWETELHDHDYGKELTNPNWGGSDESGKVSSPTGVGGVTLKGQNLSISACLVTKEMESVTCIVTAPLKLDESAVVTPVVVEKQRSLPPPSAKSKSSLRNAKRRAKEAATLLEIKEVVANAKTLADVKAFAKSSKLRDTKPVIGPVSTASKVTEKSAPAVSK